jgi:hypothetical protein
MNHLDITLAARSYCSGRALRKATLRHRRLVERPLAVVVFQLGAEPFSAAALGWGDSCVPSGVAVAGEPRNRDLAFAALLRFARWFNPLFESHAETRERIQPRNHVTERSISGPQVVVANRPAAELLARLGRRLAYLPLDGQTPADPALIRLGWHLLFLGFHSAMPGQQIVVSLTDLLNEHWVTALSPVESQSLAALDAYLDPPEGVHGFVAAAQAEGIAVGPLPGPEDDSSLQPLVETFNRARGQATSAETVDPLLIPIRKHYQPLLRRAWDVLWRCRDRELTYPEAPSVARRWAYDREAYTRHIDWVVKGGRRRARQTARQATRLCDDLEEGKRLLEAEEACDDPLRMVPYLLTHKALRGRVILVNDRHREQGPCRMVQRPLITLECPDRCLMAPGQELWWTEDACGAPWEVAEVRDSTSGGSLVFLKRTRGVIKSAMPVCRAEVCFSIHHPIRNYFRPFPKDDPWTHQPSCSVSTPASLEEGIREEVTL